MKEEIVSRKFLGNLGLHLSALLRTSLSPCIIFAHKVPSGKKKRQDTFQKLLLSVPLSGWRSLRACATSHLSLIENNSFVS